MDHCFFASSARGLEPLLKAELLQLGCKSVDAGIAGVYFSGSMQLVYKVCLWSRLASRVLMQLQLRYPAANRDQLYEVTQKIDWQNLISEDQSIAVFFQGTNDELRNSQFSARVIKDAIVDQLRDNQGWRPNVDPHRPDINVHAYLHNNKLALSLDVSGPGLHRRGYRLASGKAPLKENLAAALLISANWPKLAEQGASLLDPMCGSGTFLVEGAMIAADIAPGLLRLNFAFQKWQNFDQTTWLELLNEARQRRSKGLKNLQSRFYGMDSDPSVLKNAKENCFRAGLEQRIELKNEKLFQWEAEQISKGLVITNPPYGQRLGQHESLVGLYQALGHKLSTQCSGWNLALFCEEKRLANQLGQKILSEKPFYNGALRCHLFQMLVSPAQRAKSQELGSTQELTPGAQMVGNRIIKNVKKLDKYIQAKQLECYRAYDADIPEYAAAIDVYRDHLHIQEYRAPASISKDKAQTRLKELINAAKTVLQVSSGRVVVKTRERQSGSAQYKKQGNKSRFIQVREGPYLFLVNLNDYLDTGLFLDHRPMRQLIQEKAAGKKFLNLFCYTATATVYAMHGKASQTVSVDLSNTYLDWGKENLLLNGCHDDHQLIRADCLEWLKSNREKFDLIFMDPPTFSNSKKMYDTLDIQRDHVKLISLAMQALSARGCLYFSNNFKKFSLCETLKKRYQIKEITQQTLAPDFQRKNKKPLHRSWEITH